MSKSLRWLALAVIAATVLAPRPAAAATLSLDLNSLLGGPLLGSRKVIIQTVGRPTATLTTVITLLGGKVTAIYTSIDAVAATVPLTAIVTLLQRADVLHISSDLPVLGSMELTASAVGATAARQATGLTGAGVGVAVFDTGIAPHPDLVTPTNRIAGWMDAIAKKSTPYDDSGHGTHVAGIIAGNGGAAAKQGASLAGIAPGAHLIGVKVLDGQMRGSTSTVLSGVDFCLANKTKFNIRVANFSLGQPVFDSYRKDPLCKAVERLNRAGIVVIASAGNYGRKDASDPNSGVQYGFITAPGNDPLVITVGATRTNGTANNYDDEMASYSSRGPTMIDHVLKPDVVAPGNNVVSLGTEGALWSSSSANRVTLGGAKYFRLSGTSMAAPTVAGAVAVMLQADEKLSVDTVKIRLMHSANKSWNPNATYNPYSRGAGLLDVVKALRQPERALGPATSPTVIRLDECGEFALDGASALYGDTEEWNGEDLGGNGALWGDPGGSRSAQPTQQQQQTAWPDAQAWGNGALWGDPGTSRNQSTPTWADQCDSPD